MNKDQIITSLIEIVPKEDIIYDNDELSKYNQDWRGFYNFNSICLVFPNSKNEISKILKLCFKNNIKVVPQGGNTSLTGASVPSKNNYEILINFKKMNKILTIDKANMLIEVESGVILNKLKEYTKKINDLIPGTRIYHFGHLEDGNIHFNMIEPINFNKNFNSYRNQIYNLVNTIVEEN